MPSSRISAAAAGLERPLTISTPVSGCSSSTCWTRLRPVSPGMVRSVMTSAKSRDRSCARASAAFVAVATPKPSRSRIVASSLRSCGSSSTTRRSGLALIGPSCWCRGLGDLPQAGVLPRAWPGRVAYSRRHLEQLADPPAELVAAERLLDEARLGVEGAGAHDRVVGVAGHVEHAQAGLPLAQPLDRLAAVQPAHDQVAER